MEFYLGESITEVNVNGNCVEISDELLDFLSLNSKTISVDISSIMSINPYGDEIIPKEKIEELYFLSIALKKLDMFDYEFLEMLVGLETITRTALDSNCTIVSIGD